MKIQLLIFILFLIFPNTVFSQQKISVTLGDALAPWVIPNENSGIIIEIFKMVLEPAGYKIVPIYLPYSRRISVYKKGLVEAASDVNSNIIESEKLVGYFTGPIYEYQNYLISLSENNFAFKTLDDVGIHSLISWQGAKEHLGEDYKKLMNKNPNYAETHDQTLLI